MKLHENYLNPGPLTDSGFNRLSRCQANLQESDQMSVEPTVNGQSRLMAISGERSPGIERGLAYDSSPGGLQLETYTGNPGSMILYPDFNPSAFHHNCDLAEFRWRTSSLETGLVKAVLELLFTKPINRFSRGSIVEIIPFSATKRYRSRIFNLTSRNSKTPSMDCPVVTILMRWQKPSGLYQLNHSLERWQKSIGLNRLNHSLDRWQKNIHLYRLNHLLSKLGFLCEGEDSLLKNSKLTVC